MKKLYRIYLIAGFALNILALAVCYDKIRITLASLAPLCMLFFMLVGGLRQTVSHIKYGALDSIKYHRDGNKLESDGSADGRIKEDLSAGLDIMKIILAFVPALMPFIFFFNDGTKMAMSVLITFVGLILSIFLIAIPYAKRASEEKRRQEEKEAEELREQIRREEEGKF